MIPPKAIRGVSVAVLIGTLGLGTIGLIAMRTALLGVGPNPKEEGSEILIAVVVAFAAVGLLILWHRPRHALGWIYMLTGFALSASGVFTPYARAARLRADPLPLGELADALADVSFITGLLLPVTFGLLLFPDGRLPSRHWRPIGVLAAASLVGVFAGERVALARSDVVGNSIQLLGLFGIGIVVAAAVTSLAVRWRRSGAAERQQLKYVLGATGLLAVALLGIIIVSTFGIQEPVASIAWFGFIVSLAVVPLSVGLAVIRYRLFDIDLLIRRTVVYGATSAAIAMTFFIGVVAVQPLLLPMTGGSELSVAGSTLLCLGLFQPVRRRVQNAIDQRFDRSRYDAALTLEAFAEDLRDEVDLDSLRADLLGVVQRTMGPAHSSLWLREGGHG